MSRCWDLIIRGIIIIIIIIIITIKRLGEGGGGGCWYCDVGMR